MGESLQNVRGSLCTTCATFVQVSNNGGGWGVGGNLWARRPGLSPSSPAAGLAHGCGVPTCTAHPGSLWGPEGPETREARRVCGGTARLGARDPADLPPTPTPGAPGRAQDPADLPPPRPRVRGPAARVRQDHQISGASSQTR